MKTLTTYIQEKLIIKKRKKIDYKYFPNNNDELRQIILEKSKDKKVIDVSDIDISEVTNLFRAFGDASHIEEINGLENWDVSHVTSFHKVFNCCYHIKELKGIENWDVSNGQTFIGMFSGCNRLKSLDISKWKFNKNNTIDFYSLFEYCTELENLNLTYWDLSNSSSISHMFSGCKNLKSIGDISNWNISNKCRRMDSFMEFCAQINNIGDISNWDVSKSFNLKNMFNGCKNLQSIGDISKWNINLIIDFENMFRDCENLKLDISSWELHPSAILRNAFKNVNKKIFKRCRHKRP